jgi:hypothetical protein
MTGNCRYNDDIGGVVLSYSDIKLLHRKGRIIADQPFVHFRISCVFLAFAPQVSSTLGTSLMRLAVILLWM